MEAGVTLPSHRHEQHQLLHSLPGLLRVDIDDMSWMIPSSRGIWIPAHVDHEVHALTDTVLRTVYLDEQDRPGPSTGVVEVSTLLSELIEHLVTRPTQHGPAYETVLLDLLDRVPAHLGLAIPTPSDLDIQHITLTLETHPSDPRTLAQWAVELHMSQRTLHRRFVADVGMRFTDYRRILRTQHALHDITLGHTVTDTARRNGYSSPSAFAHAFRTTTGLTPSQARQQLRPNQQTNR